MKFAGLAILALSSGLATSASSTQTPSDQPDKGSGMVPVCITRYETVGPVNVVKIRVENLSSEFGDVLASMEISGGGKGCIWAFPREASLRVSWSKDAERAWFFPKGGWPLIHKSLYSLEPDRRRGLDLVFCPTTPPNGDVGWGLVEDKADCEFES